MPQIEGTLDWGTCLTGGAILHWPNAFEFQNSVPALFSPFSVGLRIGFSKRYFTGLTV